MVEIEAKEAVISQTLQSSQEAIAGYDIQNLPEMDQSAQYVSHDLASSHMTIIPLGQF